MRTNTSNLSKSPKPAVPKTTKPVIRARIDKGSCAICD